jgi:hypothetical protein
MGERVDPDFPELGRVVAKACDHCTGHGCEDCGERGFYKTWPDASLIQLQDVMNRVRAARIADTDMLRRLGAL